MSEKELLEIRRRLREQQRAEYLRIRGEGKHLYQKPFSFKPTQLVRKKS